MPPPVPWGKYRPGNGDVGNNHHREKSVDEVAPRAARGGAFVSLQPSPVAQCQADTKVCVRMRRARHCAEVRAKMESAAHVVVGGLQDGISAG
jgi:hypothetical protein